MDSGVQLCSVSGDRSLPTQSRPGDCGNYHSDKELAGMLTLPGSNMGNPGNHRLLQPRTQTGKNFFYRGWKEGIGSFRCASCGQWVMTSSPSTNKGIFSIFWLTVPPFSWLCSQTAVRECLCCWAPTALRKPWKKKYRLLVLMWYNYVYVIENGWKRNLKGLL